MGPEQKARCKISNQLSQLEWDGTRWGGRRTDDTVILVSHEVLQEQLTLLTAHLAATYPALLPQQCYSRAYNFLMQVDAWHPGDKGVSVWEEKNSVTVLPILEGKDT